MFVGCIHCGSGDKTYLISHVTWQDFEFKGSHGFMEGSSSLYEIILPGSVGTGILLVEIYYIEIFNPGWNFDSLNRVEVSSPLNRKLLFKITLQLHVKISVWYTELKFQLGLAKPRWYFNPGWKFQIFHIIDIFQNPEWKFDTTHTWIPCLYLKK